MNRIRLAGVLAGLVLAAGGAARAQDLRAPLAALLRQPPLRDADVAVVVTDLFTGRTLLDHHGRTPLIPASNMKLVAAAAALQFLGRNRAFTTRLRMAGRLRDGVLEGDLVVDGNGDPYFGGRRSRAGPSRWAARLHDLGVHRITGDIVLRERRLDRHYAHPDWASYPPAAPTAREVAALGNGENLVAITVRPGPRAGAPGRLEVEPDCGHVTLVNRTCTVAGRTTGPALIRAWTTNRIEVRGRIHLGSKGVSAAAAIHDPPLFLGRCLRRALRRKGIVVQGRIVRGGDGKDPGGRLVAEHRTSMGAMIRAALKTSDNRITEILAKAAGAAFTGKEGSFAGAGRAMAAVMARAGAAADGAVYRDGSGLSRRDRLTARQLVTLLAWVAGRPWAEAFTDALPAGGEAGSTLKRRFTRAPLRDCIRAKTGYLNGVRSLSGFLRVGRDRVLVFSLVVNGKPAAVRASRPAIDRFVEAVWRAAAGRPRR